MRGLEIFLIKLHQPFGIPAKDKTFRVSYIQLFKITVNIDYFTSESFMSSNANQDTFVDAFIESSKNCFH